MTQAILTLVLGLAAACLTPLAVGFLVQGTLNQMARRRVAARIKSNRLFRVGTLFSRVELQGHPVPIIGRCRVVSIGVGEVIFQSTETGDFLPVTGAEFEQLWPVVTFNDQRSLHIELNMRKRK